jgi:hypothetical protein
MDYGSNLLGTIASGMHLITKRKKAYTQESSTTTLKYILYIGSIAVATASTQRSRLLNDFTALISMFQEHPMLPYLHKWSQREISH